MNILDLAKMNILDLAKRTLTLAARHPKGFSVWQNVPDEMETVYAAAPQLADAVIEMVEARSSEAKLKLAEAAIDELVSAMKRYEMDVDDTPPGTHLAMMERARTALAELRKA